MKAKLFDESKKILGILYRTMKPLIEDFNPEMTNVYDECLKGIPHETYLQPAGKLKQEYGPPVLSLSDARCRDEKSDD